MKKIYRFCRFTMVGTLLLTFVFWGVNSFILRSTKRLIYHDMSSVPPRQAAIVLGAQVYRTGKLSVVLEDRVRTGYTLYKAGKVKKILLSGDHGRRSYDEVNAMRHYLLQLGVPEADLFMDHAGFDTYDSMYRARAIFQVKSAIVVTQSFHLPRSLYIARKLGLNAVGMEAERRRYSKAIQRHNAVREVFARVKTWTEVAIRRKPKFLGESIPITGDGRATVDHVKAQ